MNIDKEYLKTMEHGTEIVFKKYTMPVTFEFAISRYSNKINIYERHKKMFLVMNLIDNTMVMISSSGKTSIQMNFYPKKTMPKHSHRNITCRNIENFSSVAKSNLPSE